jgi:malto-oligosyltrehalose trehalohydrolase
MPFGAELMPGGGVRFRLWAPGARAVGLALEPAGMAIRPMRPEGGWFALDCRDAGAGSRYRFEIDGEIRVPDPASRSNPQGVHGPSQVGDPLAFAWTDADWRGRPWREAVLYELHVGTFSPEGSYAGVERRLDYLAELGVTAIELMPVAEFSGLRNWGYDGVLPFAPEHAYGAPEDLKRLVQAAHQRGLMVLLDVVYNHFGPDGNHLPRYAPAFFSASHQTPWGPAINFDGPGSRTVRDFFLHNALYWLEEFHFDGLRLDAVHAILDDSRPHILEELAAAVDAGPGRQRRVHLVLENDRNEASRLGGAPRRCTAQWNDDFHHTMHLLTTGEQAGYYADYADDPVGHLGRCLTQGFAFQGEPSAFRGGVPRGEPSAGLPLASFVNQLQTHDQVGNRAFGERLGALAPAGALDLAAAILLLAPSPPMLFMGEEFGAATPFLFFCDFQGQLADAVREGRQRECPDFARLLTPKARSGIPDPNAEATFARSRLDWDCLGAPPHADRLALYRRLLALRHARIIPRMDGTADPAFSRVGERGLACSWRLGDGSRLALLANLGPESAPGFSRPPGTRLCAVPEGAAEPFSGVLPPWAGIWFMAEAHRE